MGVVADHLEAMLVRVSSPDGRFTVTLTYPDAVVVGFAPGAYENYSEQAVGDQLAVVATRLWAGYRREYFAALSAAAGYTIRGDELEPDAHRRRFLAAVAELEVAGTSEHGYVRLATTGLVRWTVDIAAGALRRLTEERFLAELGSALRELLRDYDERVRMLKDEYFDLNLPGRRVPR